MEKLSQDVLDQAKAHAVKTGAEEDKIATVSADGDQARQLIKAAKSHKADLIVLGTRGRGPHGGPAVG